jgi:chromosome partitioning protein
MMTIALVGQKGGIGKTTTATNLAAELLLRAYRVLLVDADPQAAANKWVAKARERHPPAPELTHGDETMHRHLSAFAPRFDFVIIDCPGSLSAVVRSALVAADLAILPCGSSGFDGEAFVETAKQVRKAQLVRPELEARALVAHVDMRRAIARNVHDVIRQAIRAACAELDGETERAARAAAAIPQLQAALLDRAEFEEASWEGQGVTTWAPSSQAAHEVRALANEVLVPWRTLWLDEKDHASRLQDQRRRRGSIPSSTAMSRMRGRARGRRFGCVESTSEATSASSPAARRCAA